jgi:hypothetical protein
MTSLPAFQTTVDIANRALQHLGQKRVTALTDNTKQAAEINACYDKLREAELRRNVWRFAIREATLRPIQQSQATVGNTIYQPSMILVPGNWDNSKTYVVGSIVKYTDGILYIANAAVTAGTTPGSGGVWDEYFGPMIVSPYDTSGSTGYQAGELVYTPVGASPGVYLSLLNNNSDAPTTVPAYSATFPYKKGATVTYSATVYQSTEDLNLGNTPTGTGAWVSVPGTQVDQYYGENWVKIGSATVKSLTFVYPIGTGPVTQLSTQNVYMLPNGFMRKAPVNPKLGNVSSMLGRPSNPMVDDWNIEGDFLLSGATTPLYFRFVANVNDVTAMDPMFCEGLAARIALEVCETLTQSTEKLSAVTQMYEKFMTDARVVNGIETGAEEQPLEDYIACRL